MLLAANCAFEIAYGLPKPASRKCFVLSPESTHGLNCLSESKVDGMECLPGLPGDFGCARYCRREETEACYPSDKEGEEPKCKVIEITDEVCERRCDVPMYFCKEAFSSEYSE